MDRDEILHEILGKRSVRTPCVRYCRKISKITTRVLLPGLLAMPAGARRGGFSPNKAFAARVIWSVAAGTAWFRSFRFRLNGICIAKCDIRALRARLQTEVDPDTKHKILRTILKNKTAIAKNSKYIEVRLKELKEKRRDKKYQKFQTLYKQIQRM